MRAQHHQEKTAFVAGLLKGAMDFSVREIMTWKSHQLKVWLAKSSDGDLLVVGKRRSLSRGWGKTRCIPHRSLFKALPPSEFRASQVNLWRAVRAHVWAELVALEQENLRYGWFPHPVLRSVHMLGSVPGEGLLSVPTKEGLLAVERKLWRIDERVCGVTFTLKDVSICHPLLDEFLRYHKKRERREIAAAFDTCGIPQWSLMASLPDAAESILERILINHCVPTGADQSGPTKQEASHEPSG